jgi:GMP reductase
LECADAAKSLGGHIISDGGIKSSSDIAKALSAGADFVMLGSMIAGHYGCNGEVVTKDGEYFMKFYGMSSAQAMKKHSGGSDDYRTAEGKEILVPLKGHINDTLKDVFGSLRSTCTYVGAQNLSELYDNTRFIVV